MRPGSSGLILGVKVPESEPDVCDCMKTGKRCWFHCSRMMLTSKDAIEHVCIRINQLINEPIGETVETGQKQLSSKKC